MAELSSGALWKVEPLKDEMGYFAKATSKQRVEGSAWFLLIFPYALRYSDLNGYGKMLKEGNELKESLSKKQPKLEGLENSQPVFFAKNEKACSEENMKGVAE